MHMVNLVKCSTKDIAKEIWENVDIPWCHETMNEVFADICNIIMNTHKIRIIW
jgi:hypothetical protein